MTSRLRTYPPSPLQRGRYKLTVVVRPAQYEVKLKAWSEKKNVKLSDWRVILKELDELQERGVVARVKVNGQEVKKKKLLRIRRDLIKATSDQRPVVSFLTCQLPTFSDRVKAIALTSLRAVEWELPPCFL